MTSYQLETLRRTGHVEIANNGSGFSAAVLSEGRSATRRKADPNDDGDPDDRSRTSAVESIQEREARLAEGQRVAVQIETKLAKADAARVAELDGMLNRFQSYEARRLISMARANGFEFDLIMEKCCALEAEEKKILNLLKEYRRTSLGVKSDSNASRASRFLDDRDPDVRLYARMVSNQEPEEEAEPSSKKKKKKLGSREGQQEEFEEAEAGKTDKPGQTGGDDIDAQMETFYKSQGWK